MNEVVIVAAVRTPIGKYGGVFRDVRGPALTFPVMQSLIKRAEIDPAIINDVIWGCCYQRTFDETNLARVAALRSGIPKEVPGFTVHRTCTSAMTGIILGTQMIKCGDAEVVLAGGTESMSTVPYTIDELRWGARMRNIEVRDAMWDGLTELGTGVSMGITAENLAEMYGITRQEQDELAYTSHMRSTAAIRDGKFKDEIIPVSVPRGKKGEILIDTDEGPREETNLEQLGRLQTAFKGDGTVTAGNSSGLSDGSAGVVLMSASRARSLGCKPLARIVSYAVVGVDPDYMGIGPVPAVKAALGKVGLQLERVELFEVNEAFAAQYLAVERELGLNREIVNVNGSGISLGHPVGCSGARIVVTLLHEMARRDKSLGLATLCSGGGMGAALVIEKAG